MIVGIMPNEPDSLRLAPELPSQALSDEPVIVRDEGQIFMRRLDG